MKRDAERGARDPRVVRRRALAVAQTCPVRGDVAANREEHLRLGALAAAEGAEVVVFPELSLTGYELELADTLAFTPDDARLAPLRAAAAAHAITMVVGAPVRLDGALHVGALILRPDHRVQVYTKQRLGAFSSAAAAAGTVPPPEAQFFRPGDRDPLLDLAGGAAAVAVCADIGLPSHPERAAARGAQTYLASMFVIPSEFDGEAAKLGAHARRHALAVAFANYGAPSGGLAAAGRSSVWSDTGELLVQLAPAGAGVAVAEECDGAWYARAVTVDRHLHE